MNPEKIAFLTDSSADLLTHHRDGKPIYVVPLRLSCSDGTYDDGETITAADVYVRQSRGELPQTSLPDPVRVSRTLDQIQADGYRKVVVLPLSSGLSGTYNLFRLQCLEHTDLETAVWDTKSGSMGIGMVILQLWEDIQSGMSWDMLVQKRVAELLQNTYPYFSVDTLEFLQKGGRIGRITALAGTLLHIKPILTFSEDGQLVNVAKVRGRKQVAQKLIALVQAHLGSHTMFNLAVENGGDPAGMERLQEDLQAALPGCVHIWNSVMDATLAVYVGTGMLGAAIQILD